MFKIWLESSLNALYQSAVNAFPHTQARQHLVDTIEIENIRYIPFLGMNTLLVRSIAINEDRQYTPLFLFKNVNYNPQNNSVNFVAGDNGQNYTIEKLSLENTDTLVRCSCSDHDWRFNFYNYIDHSLYGKKRKPYEAVGNGPPANPQQMPGLCKHLMSLSDALEGAGIIG